MYSIFINTYDTFIRPLGSSYNLVSTLPSNILTLILTLLGWSFSNNNGHLYVSSSTSRNILILQLSCMSFKKQHLLIHVMKSLQPLNCLQWKICLSSYETERIKINRNSLPGGCPCSKSIIQNSSTFQFYKWLTTKRYIPILNHLTYLKLYADNSEPVETSSVLLSSLKVSNCRLHFLSN